MLLWRIHVPNPGPSQIRLVRANAEKAPGLICALTDLYSLARCLFSGLPVVNLQIASLPRSPQGIEPERIGRSESTIIASTILLKIPGRTR